MYFMQSEGEGDPSELASGQSNIDYFSPFFKIGLLSK